MFTINELSKIFIEVHPSYILSNDALAYVDYCLGYFKESFPTKKEYIELCNNQGDIFIDLRKEIETMALKNFYLIIVKALFESAVESRDMRYDNLLTAYDIVVGICFDEELYQIFKIRVPLFPYQTQRIFTNSIELSFGDPYSLPQEFIIPLIDYLRSSLSLVQNRPLVKFDTLVNNKSRYKYHAPLNLAGEYCTCLCEDLVDKLMKRHGPHWMEHLNYLNLISVLS